MAKKRKNGLHWEDGAGEVVAGASGMAAAGVSAVVVAAEVEM